MSEKTNLTELAQFFPAGNPSRPASRTIKGVAWNKGETYEQAVANHEARATRIQAQIARKALEQQAATS